MRIGLTIFPTDQTLDPGLFARLAEERGFESIFFPEHTHIPANPELRHPSGVELPEKYKRTYDPFVALALAAAATERIMLGTGICLVVERDPIVTAKEVASIDRLSGGRFLFGVGAGWNKEEMENHGTDPRRRFTVMRERVEAMKEIWSREEAEYHGEFVDFDSIWSWPKPLQSPHPPVIVGGDGKKVLDRVLAFGDWWMPDARQSIDELGSRIDDLQRRAGEAGRDPVPVGYFGVSGDESKLARLEELGVDRAVVMLESDPPDDVRRRIDELAPLAERFGG